MDTGALRYVRKRDFKIKVGLNPDDAEAAAEFVASIFRVVPSMKHPQLLLEVYQPITGRVQDTVLQICNNGLHYCGVYTLVPGHPELNDQDDCGQLKWKYESGRVIDHQMPLSNDSTDGEDFLVHMLCVEFDRCDIGTREVFGAQEREKPVFQLVRNCGSDVLA